LADGHQVVDLVEVETEGEPEPVAKGCTQRTRLVSSRDHGEPIEREPKRLRARALARDEVEGEVLHRRVERLFHRHG